MARGPTASRAARVLFLSALEFGHRLLRQVLSELPGRRAFLPNHQVSTAANDIRAALSDIKDSVPLFGQHVLGLE